MRRKNMLDRSWQEYSNCLGVDPDLFFGIEGTTDSELMFNLALTFGLESDPLPALERMTGFVEDVGRRHGVEHPMQMTLGLSDGRRLFGIRYSSEGESRSLYHSRDVTALREAYPELRDFSSESRAIVSEPLSGLSGVWERVPESTAVVIDGGEFTTVPFAPMCKSTLLKTVKSGMS